jgi:hypothetical protein
LVPAQRRESRGAVVFTDRVLTLMARRTIPLFPELRRYLEEAWDPEAVYVITRYRDTNNNLRTPFERIVYKAGLTPWPKLFQNLRATRETELAEQFPMHVVCEWIGNSQAVAAKHYLQVTDEHFADATSKPTETLHKPLQTVADTTGQAPTEKTVVLTNLGNNDTFSTCTDVKLVRVGFERSEYRPENASNLKALHASAATLSV